MFEVHVTVSCPDILAAAQLLAKGISAPTPAAAAPVTQTAPVQVPGPAPVAQTVPAAPVNTAAPAVPLASAPTYTLQQISKAGADLFTNRPDLRPQVNALLSQFGVQAVTDLRPEQYGAFATALRGLGAQI